MNIFIKKYFLVILIFLFLYILLYILNINDNNPLPYFNIFIYFITFLIIKESLKNTNLNYFLVKLFYYFYIYLSIGITFIIVLRAFFKYSNISEYYFTPLYIFSEIILKIFVIFISGYLALMPTKNKRNIPYRQLLLIILLAIIVIILNYSKYILNPFILSKPENWTNYAVKNYITMVLAILGLLVFWYRYYKKMLVLSEYLNVIVFIFMLSNIVETLHFVAFQLQFKIFIYGQIFNFILNLAMLYFWYVRWRYLESDLARENERYLENFQFLNGLVSKPRMSLLSRLIGFISLNYLLSVGFFGILIAIGLFLIKKITFYLLLNTSFILITIILALFLSFTSIKRDWQNQFGVLLKKQKGGK